MILLYVCQCFVALLLVGIVLLPVGNGKILVLLLLPVFLSYLPGFGIHVSFISLFGVNARTIQMKIHGKAFLIFIRCLLDVVL